MSSSFPLAARRLLISCVGVPLPVKSQPMKKFLAAVAGLVLAAMMTGRATEPADTAVVARVNGKEIKRAELNAAMRGLMMQFAQNGRSIPPEQMDEFERDVLDELINRELVLQEASAKPPAGLEDKVSAELARIEQQVGGPAEFEKALSESGLTVADYRARLRDNLIVQGAMLGLMTNAAAATPAEVQEFYDKNHERFRQPELVRARHILVRVAPTASDDEKAAKKAQIDALLVRVKAGEDFGTLAKQFSEDPGSGSNGGDLGLFPRGAMVPEFDLAAFSLETNQVSDVITTQFGYHILQVTEKKAARQVPFDEVKEELGARLQRQNGAEAAQKHISELRKSAKVEVLLAP
jgi:peptidyl-prolyl cis-trans isomerase C